MVLFDVLPFISCGFNCVEFFLLSESERNWLLNDEKRILKLYISYLNSLRSDGKRKRAVTDSITLTQTHIIPQQIK